jgi:hypothetical protein
MLDSNPDQILNSPLVKHLVEEIFRKIYKRLGQDKPVPGDDSIPVQIEVTYLVV